jgi:hypothetical protein
MHIYEVLDIEKAEIQVKNLSPLFRNNQRCEDN